ncbi:hypothetical protein SAY86_027921 [Trapa natans]|uniref:Uncharacterized protein n=1 Tax=Trapa natans TaxID=22666 RepID=A0AAN7MEQ5_TRANT|nr:hypothetical protein SAY86_027921 [Trapa natans]
MTRNGSFQKESKSDSRQKYHGGKRWRCTGKGDRNPTQGDPQVAGRQAHPQPDGGSTSHLSSAVASGGILRVVMDRRLQDQVRFCWDSDDDNLQGPAMRPPPDVPKGYLTVYVGEELRRPRRSSGSTIPEGSRSRVRSRRSSTSSSAWRIVRGRMMLVPLKTRAPPFTHQEGVNFMALDGVGKSKKQEKGRAHPPQNIPEGWRRERTACGRERSRRRPRPNPIAGAGRATPPDSPGGGGSGRTSSDGKDAFVFLSSHRLHGGGGKIHQASKCDGVRNVEGQLRAMR